MAASAAQIQHEQQYYTFAGFLGPVASANFLALPHSAQIDIFEQYLAFLVAKQVHFQSSKRSSISYAFPSEMNSDQLSCKMDPELLSSLIDGHTRSGFGVSGTEEGYLPQRALSMQAAHLCEMIGHEYAVENSKVLNSRSFMFCWCHAEKQKLVDIRNKIQDNIVYWQWIIVYVDREMCKDCIHFATKLAMFDKCTIAIHDPKHKRQFFPAGTVIQVLR